MRKRGKKSETKKNKIVLAWLSCIGTVFLVLLIFLFKEYLFRQVVVKVNHKIEESKSLPPEALSKPSVKEPAKKKTKARVALIIDDLGWNYELARSIIKMDIPLTLAILPDQKYSVKIAEAAHMSGLEVMLHIPMEPKEELNSLPQTAPLSVTMDDKEIEALTKKYLNAVPYIKGVNNHMGSRFTEDEVGMRVFLEIIKKNNLFFVDSLTTAKSVGFKTAKNMGIASIMRDVFLDHDEDIDSIRERILDLEKISMKYGYAVGICHPKKNTLIALTEMKKLFKEKGIDLVPVSELVNYFNLQSKMTSRKQGRGDKAVQFSTARSR